MGLELPQLDPSETGQGGSDPSTRPTRKEKTGGQDGSPEWVAMISPRRRYLGSWTLPSGNSADVYLAASGLACEWDTPPSPIWPTADREHWRAVTFPAILRAVAEVTGQRVLGVTR